MTYTAGAPVEVQWAVHGKRLDRRGYRLLACSTGDLGARHFEEAISRFSPGTPGELPQVTLSFAHTNTTQGGRPGMDYLALAVHQYADAMEGADEQLKYDDDGRRIVVTRYFCTPYPPLAAKAVSYQAMFQALEREPLPAGDGPALRVKLTAGPPVTTTLDVLTLQAAALLLTPRPVCVLGAEHTTMAERLAFIDTVMSLLPYGLRPRMTAATWTRPTNRDHLFRLFFSDAARTVDQPDNILYWGQPNETAVDRSDDWAFEYLTWLEDKVSEPAAELAKLIEPVGFGREPVLKVLDVIGVVGDDPKLNYSETRQDYLHPQEHMPRTVTSQDQTYGEMILRNCARHVTAGDQNKIRSDVSLLRNIVGDPLNYAHRAAYQQVLRETGLLTHGERLGANVGRLYEQLLPVAFKMPFDYEAYCQLEDCLADPAAWPSHPELLLAIERCGVSDPIVRAMLYWQLRTTDPAKLSAWQRPAGASPLYLIQTLSRPWDRPRHAKVLCDLLRQWLASTPVANPNEIAQELSVQGFLAYALQLNQVGDERYQVDALHQFLKYAYGPTLDPRVTYQILTGGHHPPTAPLLAAILLYPQPADAEVAVHAYTLGLMNSTLAAHKGLAEHITERLPVPPDAAGPAGS